MKKFVALLMKEIQLRINGKVMTLTFFELYTVHIKNRDNSFFILNSLTCLKKVTSVLLKVKNI